MKKLKTLLLGMLAASAASAQEEARFRLVDLWAEELPDQAVESINTRLSQMLNRMSARADCDNNLLELVPTLELTEAAVSEGLVREVARVQGNLTLTARTTEGVDFYAITVPLSGSAVGGREAAMNQMALSLKPTDAVFVRFIRTARKKIGEYYAAQGRPIPDCSAWEPEPQAEEPQAEEPQEIEAGEAGPEISPEAPVEAPAAPAAPAKAEAPAPALNPVIKVSVNDLDVRVVSCTGSQTSDRITIVLQLTNLNAERENSYCSFEGAFSTDGEELKPLTVKNSNVNYQYVATPEEVPVKLDIHINNVKPTVTDLARLLLRVSNAQIKISNLPVKWN